MGNGRGIKGGMVPLPVCSITIASVPFCFSVSVPEEGPGRGRKKLLETPKSEMTMASKMVEYSMSECSKSKHGCFILNGLERFSHILQSPFSCHGSHAQSFCLKMIFRLDCREVCPEQQQLIDLNSFPECPSTFVKFCVTYFQAYCF